MLWQGITVIFATQSALIQSLSGLVALNYILITPAYRCAQTGWNRVFKLQHNCCVCKSTECVVPWSITNLLTTKSPFFSKMGSTTQFYVWQHFSYFKYLWCCVYSDCWQKHKKKKKNSNLISGYRKKPKPYLKFSLSSGDLCLSVCLLIHGKTISHQLSSSTSLLTMWLRSL